MIRISGTDTMFYLRVLVFFSCIILAAKVHSAHGQSAKTLSSTTPFNWNLSSFTVEEKMRKLGIIPHIIAEPPSTIVNISYKYFLRSIYLQNEGDDTIPHHKLVKTPKMYFNRCDPKKYYSSIMTLINITRGSKPNEFNPESLKNAKQYHSMLYTNIAYCNLRYAEEIFPYEPPSSNENNEIRIYLFLLLEQKTGKVHMGFKEKYNNYFFRDEKHHNSFRSNFTIKEFIEHFETDIVAGNYMRVVTLPKQQPILRTPYNYFRSFSNRLRNLF